MRSKKHKFTFDRKETSWLYRQVKSAFDRAEGIMKLMQGRNDLTDKEAAELKAAQEGGPFLLELSRNLESLLNKGAEEKMGQMKRTNELNQVLELADEPEAKQLAEQELATIPKDEPYDFVMDRQMVKFFLDLVEKNITDIRTSVIPAYEKEAPETFLDPLRPRSYYINKTRKTKEMLERMRERMEKAL